MTPRPGRRERDGRRAEPDRGGRGAEQPDLVTVVAPVSHPHEGYVVYEDTRRAAAGRRLERTLAALREAGIPAHGLVVESDPADAVRDAIAMLDPKPTEIIVSTHPKEKSGWLRRKVIDRVRDAAGGLPVEHVVVDLDRTGRRGERARDRERDGRRRPAARAHPRARGALAGELPDHLPAERPDPAPSIPRRSGGCGARSRSCAARGSTRTARSRTPIRTRPRCRPSTTSGSTRSSSRPSRPSARPGCGRTSSSGCTTTPSCRSSTCRARGGRRFERCTPKRITARRSRTRAPASTRRRSGCSSSSRRRSCSSARSSRPTSSSGSWTTRPSGRRRRSTFRCSWPA